MTTMSSERLAGGLLVAALCFILGAVLAGCGQPAAPPQTTAQANLGTLGPEVETAAVDTEPTTGQPTEQPPEQADNAAEQATDKAGDAAAKTSANVNKETVEIGACDGGEPITVSKDLKGQALADSLMAQWQHDHPEANWVEQQKERHALKPPADNSDLLKGEQGADHTYGNYTERDLLTWARETEKLVAEGSRIFHNGDELGSTVAVSCDMCHPHAANTHPETYPKYQVQLGRVALLRDMINWCVENPVRGEKFEADSPTMRALEAYIQSQRKGVPLNYGKH